MNSRQHFLLFILEYFTSSPTNRLWDTDHDGHDPGFGGSGDQMCDSVWQSQDNNNNGILEPSEELLPRCEETDHLWSIITFYVKRGCGEILRDLLKSVTLTWLQRDKRRVPTDFEHYWSIVLFSRRGSFCRQPGYYCDTDIRQGEKLGAKRKRIVKNLDQDIDDDDKGFFYWEVTPNIKDDVAGRRSINNLLTTTDIFKVPNDCKNKSHIPCHLLLHNSADTECQCHSSLLCPHCLWCCHCHGRNSSMSRSWARYCQSSQHRGHFRRLPPPFIIIRDHFCQIILD